MLLQLAKRMLTETDKRLLWKFAYNFGYKGMRSVQLYKKRLKQGIHFPPFLFISIINSCQLRCQGCWVDVESPREMISLDDLNRVINDAKKHGNSYFGILGGEPFMHPHLLDMLAAHPDCYFQIFTNGQLITDEVAAELRRIGNVSPLISIEGTSIVSDERRGRLHVLDRTLAGLENCRQASADHRRRHQRLPDQHRRPGQRGLAAATDRHGRALRLVPHLPRGRAASVAGAGADAGAGAAGPQVHRRRCGPSCRSASWMPTGTTRAQALCPMATGVSHHIGPSGRIEPCPIIQFATEGIHDGESIYDLMTQFGVSAGLPRDVGQGDARLRRAGAARPGQVAGPEARRPRHDAASNGACRAGRLRAPQQPAQSRRGNSGRALAVPVRQEALVLRLRGVHLRLPCSVP